MVMHQPVSRNVRLGRIFGVVCSFERYDRIEASYLSFVQCAYTLTSGGLDLESLFGNVLDLPQDNVLSFWMKSEAVTFKTTWPANCLCTYDSQ